MTHSLRVWQLAASTLILLMSPCMVTVTSATEGSNQAADEVVVGVYRDVGAGASVRDLLKVLRELDGVYVRELTAREIQRGAADGVDILIQPGGSGSKQANQLGEDGRQRIRQFVREGGGYIGICAGAYLASADYTWSLDLLDARVLDRKHWARGTGNVEIEFTNQGQQKFGTGDELVTIFYGQGPLLSPAGNPDIPDYELLASYKTEIAKKGAPRGVMPGTTAIAIGQYGEGQVLCFSPHPEKTEGLEHYVHRAIELVRGESSFADASTELTELDLDAVKSTPDISQKGLPNGHYCAPCAIANLIGQFKSRDQIARPKTFSIAQGASPQASDDDGRSLATLLGDSEHMNALGRKGTNRYRLVNGFDRYVDEHALGSLQIDYLGIRNYDRSQIDEAARSRTTVVVGIPQLSHVQQYLSEDRGVAILFGSYRKDPDHPNRFKRIGGHYVAAVGCGQNENGAPDSTALILHDSNDSHQGEKYVHGETVSERIELWDNDERLAASQRLVRLRNAPIRKDGRIAFLETVFAFSLTID